jgi:RimJ/RimL family protein N-acetyltransferase
MALSAPPVLEGNLVRLEHLEQRHAADLAALVDDDRGSFAFTRVPSADAVEEYISAQLERAEEGTLVPYAQIRRVDRLAVGCTSLWNPRFWPDRPEPCAIEIGWTWLVAAAQRSGINVESKLLLMTYAFETLGVARVDLKTDARNERSRRAIAHLGARFEGVLRQWSASHVAGEEGLLRDSAMFSVIAAEWPEVKQGLLLRLARRGAL